MDDLIAAFEARLPQTLHSIGDCLERQDWQGLHSVAHQLKGSGGSFGHPRLTEIAQAMLVALKSEAFDRVRMHYEDLRQHIGRIIPEPGTGTQ
jgi:HPt (histidine-containing phosphotransfer) domain-containing protein